MSVPKRNVCLPSGSGDCREGPGGASWTGVAGRGISIVSLLRCHVASQGSAGYVVSPHSLSHVILQPVFEECRPGVVMHTFLELIYNVVLISAVQQSDSVIHIYIYIIFSYSFPLWFITGY